MTDVMVTKTPKLKVSALDKAVNEALRNSGVDKASLSAAVKIARDLDGKGVKVVRAFPNGTPRPDLVEIEAHFSASQLDVLIRIFRDRRAKGIIVFPKGIPVPDIWIANIQVQ